MHQFGGLAVRDDLWHEQSWHLPPCWSVVITLPILRTWGIQSRLRNGANKLGARAVVEWIVALPRGEMTMCVTKDMRGCIVGCEN
jgi:hypothetical protein